MRLAMIEDPHLLEQRRRRDVDRLDEVWEGVLHMVPPPAERHGYLEGRLLIALDRLVSPRGLRIASNIGFYRADNDFRIPDLSVYRLDQKSARGVEAAAELVVEIVSPRDESRTKLPWYAARAVREVLLIDRDSLAVELYACETGVPVRVDPAYSKVLDCTFTTLDPEHLEVAGPEATVVVSP